MPVNFAKLFVIDGIGQVLVKLDMKDEDGTPEVRFYTQPDKFGVCSIAAGYSDDDEGWDEAESYFNRIDERQAIKAIKALKQSIGA